MGKELTILIPTKNRSNWILRILKYYAYKKFNGKIIIGDSSDNYHKKRIKTLVKKFDILDIDLFYSFKSTAEEMLEIISSKINSKYSIFLSDDDIFKIDYLSQFIDFLNFNDDYIGVVGNAFMIKVKKNKPWGKISKIRNYDLFFTDEANSAQRLIDYFNKVSACNMAIVRTSVFKVSLKNIYKLDKYHQRYIFGEYFWAINYLINGKIKHLNFPFLVRQTHDTNIYSKIDKKDFFTKGNLNNSLNLLEKQISKSINNHKNIHSLKEKILKNINNAFYKKEKNLLNFLFLRLKILIYDIYHKIFYLNRLRNEIKEEINFIDTEDAKI